MESETATKVTNFEDGASRNAVDKRTSVENIIASIKSEEFTIVLDKGPSRFSVSEQPILSKAADICSLVETFRSDIPREDSESVFNLVEPLSEDSSVISELKRPSSDPMLSQATDSQLTEIKVAPKDRNILSFGKFLFRKTLCIPPSVSQTALPRKAPTKRKEQETTETSTKKPTVVLQVTEIGVTQEPKEENENLSPPASISKKIKPHHISFSLADRIFPSTEVNVKKFHQELVEKLQKACPEARDIRLNRKYPKSEKSQRMKKLKSSKAVSCDSKETFSNTAKKLRSRRTKKSRRNKLSSDKSRHSRCRLYKKTLKLCKEAYEKARERRKQRRRLKRTTRFFPATTFHDTGITTYTSEREIKVVRYTSSANVESKPKKVDIGVGSFQLDQPEYKDEMVSARSEPSSSHSSLLSELQQKTSPKPTFFKSSQKVQYKVNLDQSPLELSISDTNLEDVQKTKSSKKRVPLTDRSIQTFSSDVTYESSKSAVTSITISSDSESTDIRTSRHSPVGSNQTPTQIHKCITCLKSFQRQDSFTNTIVDPRKFQYQMPRKFINFGSRAEETQQCENCMYLKQFPESSSSKKKCYYVEKKRRRFHVPPLNLNSDSPKSRPVDHFKDRVKYEIIRETPRSSTSCSRSPTHSPRSPLNVNYQIYVPRFDTFVTSSSVCEKLDMPTGISKQIDEFRHVQRTKRLQHLFKVKREQNDGDSRDTSPSPRRNVQRTITATKNRYSVTFNKDSRRSYETQPSHQRVGNNREAQKRMVKDYYKKINNRQATDNLSVVTGDQNKFMKFIKGIFRKVINSFLSYIASYQRELKFSN